MTDNRPLAVFDSGVGGLTVLKPLLKAFPRESFIYLGDTARLPYGTKSLSTLQLYLKQMASYLLEMDIKGLVIACHSASSAWLESAFDLPVPVWEMISPACQMALEHSRGEPLLGLLATKATVRSGAYERTLKSLDPDKKLVAQSCPLFVPLIEEGLEEDPITAVMAQKYLSEMEGPCHTLILGCTHYPLLAEALKKASKEKLQLIDPAEALVELMAQDQEKKIWLPAQDPPFLRLLTTDTGSDLWDLAHRILSGKKLPPLELVSITPRGLT